jgi:hypothetical protein
MPTVAAWPAPADVQLRLIDSPTGCAMTEVDADGNPLGAFPKITEVRDGGGHLELFEFVVDEAAEFDRNPDQTVKIHY